MLSFEAALSSSLILSAFILVLNTPQIPYSNLTDLHDFLQISDYANAMSASPCDFSKVNLDKNFCYSCEISNLTYYSNPSCSQTTQNKKISVNIPIYTFDKIEKMSVSKY